MKPPICDFCSHPEPTLFFKAEDFELIEGWAGSKGDWAACPECAALVEESKWAELADRCLRSPHDAGYGMPSWEDMQDEYAGLKAMLVEMYGRLAFNINGHSIAITERIA